MTSGMLLSKLSSFSHIPSGVDLPARLQQGEDGSGRGTPRYTGWSPVDQPERSDVRFNEWKPFTRSVVGTSVCLTRIRRGFTWPPLVPVPDPEPGGGGAELLCPFFNPCLCVFSQVGEAAVRKAVPAGFGARQWGIRDGVRGRAHRRRLAGKSSAPLCFGSPTWSWRRLELRASKRPRFLYSAFQSKGSITNNEMHLIYRRYN